MRGFRLFERPIAAFSSYPPLMVQGALPVYRTGEPYEGRLDILNAVGRSVVEIVWEESYLPPGASAHVDQFTQEVVLRFPAYVPPETEKEGILNWDFSEGDLTGWHDRRGGGWHVARYDNSPESEIPPNNNPPTELGNYAAYMTGVGRGDWILESDRYPVEAGQQIMARSLWDQGPSNKDNNNLFTALNIWRNDYLVDTIYGDRIHDRTNRQRHWSTVNFTVLPTYTDVSILLIAHRRNNRNRPIIVDNVETSGLVYSLGPPADEDYFVKLKVTDSINRVAYWEGPLFFHSVFYTSAPYPIHAVESFGVGFAYQGGQELDAFIEQFNVSFALQSVELRDTVAYKTYDHPNTEAFGVSFALQEVGLVTTVAYKAYEHPNTEAFAVNFALQEVVLTVTTGYVDYTPPEDEAFTVSFALQEVTLT